jgi:hypothetical protein
VSEQPERQPTVAPTDPEDRADARTGDDQVDAALAPLAALDELPVDEHVAVLEQAHAALREALSRPAEPA